MSSTDAVDARRPARADGRARRYRGAFLRLYRGEMRLLLTRRRNMILLGVLGVVPIFIGIAVKISNAARRRRTAVHRPRHRQRPVPRVHRDHRVDPVLPATGHRRRRRRLDRRGSRLGHAALPAHRSRHPRPAARRQVPRSRDVHDDRGPRRRRRRAGHRRDPVRPALAGLLSGDTVGLGNGLLRTLGVVAYVDVALFALAAGGLFISTLTENAIAAMAATVSIAVLSALLDAVPQLSAIHPALLTDHWLGFGELLRSSISGTDLARWTALHLAYAAIFLSLAWSRITSKDITS